MPSNIGRALVVTSLVVLASLAALGQQLSANSNKDTKDTAVIVPEAGLPDVPSASAQVAPSTSRDSSRPGSPGRSQQPASAARGGWLGASHAADRKFWGMTSILFASSLANAELTTRCSEQHTCSYVPPTFRSRLALYGLGLPADAGVSYVSLKMKASRSRLWWVPDAIVTAANTYVGIHAARRLR